MFTAVDMAVEITIVLNLSGLILSVIVVVEVIVQEVVEVDKLATA